MAFWQAPVPAATPANHASICINHSRGCVNPASTELIFIIVFTYNPHIPRACMLLKVCGRCMKTSPYTVSGHTYLSNGNPAIPSLREAPRCLLQERLACMILLMDHDSIWKTICSSNLGSIAHLADWSFACNSCAARTTWMMSINTAKICYNATMLESCLSSQAMGHLQLRHAFLAKT